MAATSSAVSDDALADEFQRRGILMFRGPLEDVLARYALAAANLPDDCLVIRLTGDNVVPDGEFVEELASVFVESAVEYVVASSPQSRLPYGLIGEAFLVSTLRKANAAVRSPYDREHVTPWIERNCPSAIFAPRAIGDRDFSHLRCTIDDQEDYERMRRLFERIADPVHVPWLDLAQKLTSLSGEPAFRVPYKILSGQIHSELVLGTAQLGMEYGIVNRSGKPSRSSAVKIVRTAIAHGVTAIDAARAYDDAETVIGEALAGAWRSRAEVVTKLNLAPTLAHDADQSEVRAAVDLSVGRSCAELKSPRLSTLLLHDWEHYRAWNGAAWNRMVELRDEGMITRLGASVYAPHEALAALRDPAIQLLQLPMNVLDWRWKAAGVDHALSERPDVVVHARSALLQGLLASPAESWPVFSPYEASACKRRLQELCVRFGRQNVTDLCLAYVRSQSWITSAVVGCETLDQLQQNLSLFRTAHLTEEQSQELEKSLPTAPEELLNPSQWKLVHEQSPS